MKFLRSLAWLMCITAQLHAFDTAHFFRPPFLERGPWFEKTWLSALFVNVADGKTHHARNCAGTKVPLLDIYGTSNIQASTHNVPDLDPTLSAIAAIPAMGNFSTVSLGAKEHMTELVFEGYQNFEYGLFIHAHLPVRWLSVSSIYLCDLSNPASNSAAWQAFLQNYPAILHEYGLSVYDYKEQSVGDFGIALGWTKNYEDFEHLDFLDMTFQVGVTTPTSKQLCPNHILAIPLGYDGHTGIFGKVDLSIGVCDWLTFSNTFSAIGFNKHTVQQRVKTDASQTGVVLLTTAPVRESLGPIFSYEFLFKADHVVLGFSLDVAYQFQHQWNSSWQLCGTNQPYSFSDQRLQSWSMHTINAQLSYDFSDINHPCAPTFGILVNVPVGGHRIFTPTMGGLSCALMTSWDW